MKSNAFFTLFGMDFHEQIALALGKHLTLIGARDWPADNILSQCTDGHATRDNCDSSYWSPVFVRVKYLFHKGPGTPGQHPYAFFKVRTKSNDVSLY